MAHHRSKLTGLAVLLLLDLSSAYEWFVRAVLSILTLVRVTTTYYHLLENLRQCAHSPEGVHEVFTVPNQGVPHGSGLTGLLLADRSPTDDLLVSHFLFAAANY